MSKEKTFPLKISGNNVSALKEEVHNHVSGDQVRIKVSFGLTDELSIAEPAFYTDGLFTNISSISFISDQGTSLYSVLGALKRENRVIYFPLDSLNYIGVHTIILVKGEVVKSTLQLYIPLSLSNWKLVCRDVSSAIPRQTRAVLAEKCLEYSLSRV